VSVAPQILVPQWGEAEKLSTSWAENSRLARRINTKARICECAAELASPGAVRLGSAASSPEGLFFMVRDAAKAPMTYPHLGKSTLPDLSVNAL
jgi:hypothetical protein